MTAHAYATLVQQSRAAVEACEFARSAVWRTFGAELRQARKDTGWGRLKFAQAMGRPNEQKAAAGLARWERGDELPNADCLDALCRVLPQRDPALRRHHAAAEAAARAQEAAVRLAKQAQDLRLEFNCLLLLAGADPQQVEVDGSRDVLGVVYRGGVRLSAAQLATLWRTGAMSWPCDCGGTVRLLTVGPATTKARGFCVGHHGISAVWAPSGWSRDRVLQEVRDALGHAPP